jgi:dephospho-CoA kinase
VAPGAPGLAAVTAAFGPGVLAVDGSLDRPKLGEIVFADDGQLQKLNAILHPLIGERTAELERQAPAGAMVVHDVALLTENGLASRYDVVVVVDAPPDVQLDRLVRQRGMPADQARARLAAQATREQRLAVADLVVDNSGPIEALDAQVDALWEELRRRQR